MRTAFFNGIPADLTTAAVTTFFFSAFLGIFVLHFFPRWGLMDNPQKYGHQRRPIPLPGGVAPVVALVASLLIFFPHDGKYFSLAAALALLAAVSFWDDRRQVSPLIRLPIHFAAALIVVFGGIAIEYLGNPFGSTITLSGLAGWLPGLVTAVWLVGFANVMNWLDGVPGLSAASASVAGVFLAILSLSPAVAQPEIARLALVFAAAAAGFLVFNFPPPRMLLGDTGAMAFGFFLAALTVFSGGKMATAFIVLALPMLDAFYVFTRRLLTGKNPLMGRDRLHLHDRLHDLGVSNREILLLFLASSLSLGWLSLQLQTLGKIILVLCLAVVFLCFSYCLDKLLQKKIFHQHP